ncbi:MAG: hypothetical protein AAFQ36_06280 [Pseudomonadota bacterium]
MSQPPIALVHGLGPRVGAMWPMARRFRAAGLRAVCLGYDTRRLERAAAKRAVRQQMLRIAPDSEWDVVGFSMGGLLGAELMFDEAPPVRRLVQIGSPNDGSPLANRVLDWPVRPLGRMGESVRVGEGLTVDLADRRNDITVIVGTGWGDRFGLGAGNDGMVPAASAKAVPHRVCVEVAGFHARLPLMRSVQDAALAAITAP